MQLLKHNKSYTSLISWVLVYIYLGSENLTDVGATPARAPSVPSDLSKMASGLPTPKGKSRLPGPKAGSKESLGSSRESLGRSRESLGGSRESTPGEGELKTPKAGVKPIKEVCCYFLKCSNDVEK